MSGLLDATRVRWMVAGGAGVVISLSLLLLFRFPTRTALPTAVAASVSEPPKPVVRIAARDTTTDALLSAEAEIRDPRPLFLPTEFNVALPEPRREPGRSFLDNEKLKLGFAEAEVNVSRELPPVVTVNGKSAEQAQAVDLLAEEPVGSGLFGFGRRPVEGPSGSADGGKIEVTATATGGRVFASKLPPDARAPGGKPWEPVELLARVDSAGLSVPLMVLASSQVEEVDVHYRNYLAQRYRIGDRLPPGSYRIVVGP